MEFQAAGTQFRLERWDGDILAIRLAPNGRFAAMAKNLGDQPSGLGAIPGGRRRQARRAASDLR
jgi:hypothetical protein